MSDVFISGAFGGTNPSASVKQITLVIIIPSRQKNLYKPPATVTAPVIGLTEVINFTFWQVWESPDP